MYCSCRFSSSSPSSPFFFIFTSSGSNLFIMDSGTGSNVCMNFACGSILTTEWKKGWALRSGQFAQLCDNCGIAFDEMNFCEKFHSKESGWRECTTCKKALHCGCVASLSLIQPLDGGGGVNCILCSASSLTSSHQEANYQIKRDKTAGGFGSESPLEGHKDDPSTNSSEDIKAVITVRPFSESGIQCGNLNQTPLGFPNISTVLSVSLGNPDHSSNLKTSSPLSQPVSRPQCVPSKPSKSPVSVGMESNTSMAPHIGSLRPPVEVVRSRSHLLPRYWPRITDLELQQISGDSNSTIVPLFEKVLSASDAGRIGRLVLPKACAEAYFPPISQPEGLPLRIQDVKGKDWTFQFRFWPNNNSRMYVLEGVTPCIHSMQLRAGDTVTFSRMEPEGKLIMGFRKVPHPSNSQDGQGRSAPTVPRSIDNLLSDVVGGLPTTGDSYLSLLRSFKGCTDTHFGMQSNHPAGLTGAGRWVKAEGWGEGMRENPIPSSAEALLSEQAMQQKQQQRYVGMKNKRPAIDSECTLEIRVTWEELQGLFRPPPCSNPTVITVEEYEVEEYEKPPVFGKWGIFTTRTTGGVEQWGQCDKCFKWRKMPVDYLLPPTWTCSDNTWDSKRWCSAAEELSPEEVETLIRLHSEFKRRRGEASPGVGVALFGGDVAKPLTESAVAMTTKHPRHRPGCSCIVCIQPPSGKGKHKPTCVCNVCMTVKRRFKTLMMRKKKRQSECEAEIAQRCSHQRPTSLRDETEAESSIRLISYTVEPSSKAASNCPGVKEEERGEEVDLNSEAEGGLKGMSMMSLVEVATLPLESYLKQQGIQSLLPKPDASSSQHQQHHEKQDYDEEEQVY